MQRRTLCPKIVQSDKLVFAVALTTLTTPRSREVTRLTWRLPRSASSLTFQILTVLSMPPVAMHPRMCGLMSRADAAPSCADSVKREGDGESRSEGSARASKLTTIPFPSETCQGYQTIGEYRSRKYLRRTRVLPKDPIELPLRPLQLPHQHQHQEPAYRMYAPCGRNSP